MLASEPRRGGEDFRPQRYSSARSLCIARARSAGSDSFDRARTRANADDPSRASADPARPGFGIPEIREVSLGYKVKILT